MTWYTAAGLQRHAAYLTLVDFIPEPRATWHGARSIDRWDAVGRVDILIILIVQADQMSRVCRKD